MSLLCVLLMYELSVGILIASKFIVGHTTTHHCSVPDNRVRAWEGGQQLELFLGEAGILRTCIIGLEILGAFCLYLDYSVDSYIDAQLLPKVPSLCTQVQTRQAVLRDCESL